MDEAHKMTRRAWLAALTKTAVGATALSTLASVTPATATAESPRKIVVYKDPSCGCCKAWVSYLRANGFTPEVHDRNDMDALKDSLGVPSAMRSCHTAVVGRYLVEGHVSAPEITRLMATAPKGVAGLAVPGMPAGSPGMEMGSRKDKYDVLAFHGNGATTVFARHG